MQRDSKTDLAEPYEVRPSNRRLSCGLWVCNGQNAEQHWQVKDILAIPGETVLEVGDKDKTGCVRNTFTCCSVCRYEAQVIVYF